MVHIHIYPQIKIIIKNNPPYILHFWITPSSSVYGWKIMFSYINLNCFMFGRCFNSTFIPFHSFAPHTDTQKPYLGVWTLQILKFSLPLKLYPPSCSLKNFWIFSSSNFFSGLEHICAVWYSTSSVNFSNFACMNSELVWSRYPARSL